jgi:Uma2 family endonuclease
MATPQITPAPLSGVPPLESGDHLTRDEFERRYRAMPRIHKAELIEGVVYMPSPVRFERHSSPHADLMGWLAYYKAYTPGVGVGDNGTVRLDLENEPQPDGFMIVMPKCGGRVAVSVDDYIEGAPDLVVEVAASSASFDLHTKLRVYRRNEVREYVVWRVLDGAIDWFILRQGAYAPLPLSAAGFYQSEVFPGLWLDPAALGRGDLAAVLQVLEQGIASPEHAAFVARLQQAASQGH